MLKSKLHRGVSAACLMFSLTAGVASAQQAADGDIETITIHSSGEIRQVQSVDNEALREDVPGVSPLKEIALLPGVKFNNSDYSGSYESGARLSIRGFDWYQLGFTLDGVPLGDMWYGNWNGLSAARAVISENIARTEVSQGAGALSTASTSNLGGTVQLTTRDPANIFGGEIAQTFGSDSMFRTYARVDSGKLNDSGTKFDVSVAHNESSTWTDDHQPQRQDQVNFKIAQPLGDSTELTAFFNWSNLRQTDYPAMSPDMISALGYNWGAYTPSQWSGASVGMGQFTQSALQLIGLSAQGGILTAQGNALTATGAALAAAAGTPSAATLQALGQAGQSLLQAAAAAPAALQPLLKNAGQAAVAAASAPSPANFGAAQTGLANAGSAVTQAGKTVSAAAATAQTNLQKALAQQPAALIGYFNSQAAQSQLAAIANTIGAADLGGSTLRDDMLGGITLNTELAPGVTSKTTLYGHTDGGTGLLGTPFAISPATGAPLSLRTTEYKQVREGVIEDVTWTAGDNTVAGGFWYGHERFNDARRYYNVSATASPSFLSAPSNPAFTQYATDFDTDIVQGYLQDTYKFENGLTVYAGFKGSDTSSTAHQLGSSGTDITLFGPLGLGMAPPSYASGTITAADSFLPQLGASYDITPDDQVFFDVAENMREFVEGPDFNPFDASQAYFDANKPKPEKSWTEEVGYRLHHGPVTATVDYYHINFNNRQITGTPSASNCALVSAGLSALAALAGCPIPIINAGGVTSNGAEVSVDWKVLDGLHWYNGLSYSKSTYDDDIQAQFYSPFQPIAGKNVVDSPNLTWKTQLSYHHDGFFGILTGNYMSKRYVTYLNDQSVPDVMTFDLSVGYDLDSAGIAPVKGARIQLNVENLTDKKYVSVIGSGSGFAYSGPSQNLMLAAPRAFFGTISARF